MPRSIKTRSQECLLTKRLEYVHSQMVMFRGHLSTSWNTNPQNSNTIIIKFNVWATISSTIKWFNQQAIKESKSIMKMMPFIYKQKGNQRFSKRKFKLLKVLPKTAQKDIDQAMTTILGKCSVPILNPFNLDRSLIRIEFKYPHPIIFEQMDP